MCSNTTPWIGYLLAALILGSPAARADSGQIASAAVCADISACLDSLETTLPDPAAAKDRRIRLVGLKLGMLFRNVTTALDRATLRNGNAKLMQFVSAKSALSAMAAKASLESSRGRLSSALEPLLAGIEGLAIQIDSAAGLGTYRLKRQTYDLDNNGTAEGTRTYRYDALGRLVSTRYSYRDDRDEDTDFGSFFIDAPTERSEETLRYDAGGRLSRYTVKSPSSRVESRFEFDADALLSSSAILFGDASGRRELRFEFDYDNQRMLGWRSTLHPATVIPFAQSDVLSYDAQGRVQQDMFQDSTGGPTATTEYTYGDDGRIEAIRRTSSGSDFEQITQFIYDDARHLAERVSNRTDIDEATSWAYTLDQQGLPSEWRIDLDADGTVEAVVRMEWEKRFCRRVFLWAPRAEPNFVLRSGVPYAPGSGFAVLPSCMQL